jgi:N-acetylglucosamine-6-phosphate deacetylase
MIIKNANVYKESGSFEIGDVYIHKDRIAGRNVKYMGSFDSTVIDATGLYAIPGLTDLHFHGCFGYDFCDGTKEAFDTITRYEAEHGITAVCPATMTLPGETLADICQSLSKYPNDSGSILCGVHLEGPFLSAKKKGAQNEAYLKKPDIEMYQQLQELSGNRIKIVSIAPEEEGAMDFISNLKNEVVLSIAHTTADYETAMMAFRKGACHVTHLFNAMPPFHHRDPGVIGAAIDYPDCRVELICDGIHLHPSVINAAFRLFGKDRIIFISDSMMAAGLPDGSYFLGGQEVNVTGKKATLADGTIAGSVTNLMDSMINAVINIGIPLETAVQAAAVNPAKEIGIYKDYGSITPGKIANIVLLDADLNIKAVILKGLQYDINRN